MQQYKSKYIRSTPVLESDLEKATLKVLKDKGCLTYKFVSPTKRGVPDDIVFLSNGIAVLIEFKNPRGIGTLSKLQEHQIAKIRNQGFTVFVVDSLKSADNCIDDCIDMSFGGDFNA